MRRPVFRRSATGMALFPFLAVLICTMGALIVLLVMVLQQARVQATAAAVEESRAREATRSAAKAQKDEKLEQIREDLEWRQELLQQQRTSQSEELAKQRLELSHLEDHIRRLEDQWKQTLKKLQELQKVKENKEATEKASRDQLVKLQQEIEAAKREFEEARRKAFEKPPSFALVPYVGKNGVRRRPIYIECTEEGIVLHPERVVFLPADFNGPMGPGNPLDAALRTVREYWARTSDPRVDGEPYPLLIVRPNGAVAYAMARGAMKSWDEEFGYELVDDELRLEFPPPDPELDTLLTRTIKDARERQTLLAAAMPSRYK
ncbi:MAG TPA: hypothetical protein PLV92_03890, partial [Pirellulaceae bacterium]|nr:hypothetical protein [Pirellulaceae bacterium]